MAFQELCAVVKDLLEPLQQLDQVVGLAAEELHSNGVGYLGKGGEGEGEGEGRERLAFVQRT